MKLPGVTGHLGSQCSSPTNLNVNRAFAPESGWNVHATDICETDSVQTGFNDISGNFYTFLLQPK